MNDWNQFQDFNTYNMFPNPSSSDFFIQNSLLQQNMMQQARINSLSSDLYTLKNRQFNQDVAMAFYNIDFKNLSKTRKLLFYCIMIYMFLFLSFFILNLPYVQQYFTFVDTTPDFGFLEPIFSPIITPIQNFAKAWVSNIFQAQNFQ